MVQRELHNAQPQQPAGLRGGLQDIRNRKVFFQDEGLVSQSTQHEQQCAEVNDAQPQQPAGLCGGLWDRSEQDRQGQTSTARVSESARLKQGCAGLRGHSSQMGCVVGCNR
jgi:hypothetical protein